MVISIFLFCLLPFLVYVKSDKDPTNVSGDLYPFYARVTEFWMKGGRMGFTHFCGAAILTSRLLMSSAHCFFKESPKTPGFMILRNNSFLRIFTGDFTYDFLDEYSTKRLHNVSRMFYPRNYNSSCHLCFSTYDIAIIEVSENTPITFDKGRDSIPLCVGNEYEPDPDNPDRMKYKFGLVGLGLNNERTTADKLQALVLWCMDERACADQYNSEINDPLFVNFSTCFVSQIPHQKSSGSRCQEDDGAPIFITDAYRRPVCLYALNNGGQERCESLSSSLYSLAAKVMPFFTTGIFSNELMLLEESTHDVIVHNFRFYDCSCGPKH